MRGSKFWFMHLAEGTDEAAAGEYSRLKALGAFADGMNPILIHCVGITRDDLVDWTEHSIGGVVWCPSTNLYLLGNTLDMRLYEFDPEININAVGLGSDSRLTADGDLLDEIHAARPLMNADTVEYGDYTLRHIVFMGNAFLTGIESLYGYLKLGAPADWIALPADRDILDAHRADLALVVRGGIPQIGDPDVMAKFPHIETVAARLDDKPKSINVALARQIARCSLKEPGLELLAVPDTVSPVKRMWNGVLKR
jgi:cytosine/adenosine deaminase-related metal-dependent hydrolase